MICYTIPCKLESLPNKREHWGQRASRARIQREAAHWQTMSALADYATKYVVTRPSLPLIITITRLGKRRLDSDNLAASAKHVRDGIADALKIDDGNPGIEWIYDQKQSSEYSVDVEIQEV